MSGYELLIHWLTNPININIFISISGLNEIQHNCLRQLYEIFGKIVDESPKCLKKITTQQCPIASQGVFSKDFFQQEYETQKQTKSFEQTKNGCQYSIRRLFR